ncbi:DUF1700 domain-containing protein [Limosilactobacillus antri]|uniref:DUF1700 domain-containing protein n=1 Tax=Limosilactobacillus antri DSM 16041 TaxID=525309 RepID=C8P6T8_9LACO|nr:DUF1700 domain-containing protein [Limosilactobacillus antri]EEW53876.1 hypothetical protein HMPREF0494_1032 [Limosilactobacillus antri DSM 16041]KRK60970.1 hypothetical protein FC31_GL000163 [Limosilactobacillus antri DSM 16041]
MNAREKYIQELGRYLNTLPAAERADAIDFYDEYIADAQYDTWEQITAELGTPRQLSHQILADYSIKANEQDRGAGKVASTKSSWRVFWLVLIAIVTSPITLVLSIVALGILIAALGAVIGIILGLLGIIVGLLVTAGAMLYLGVGLIAAAPMTGIFYLGLGLVVLGGFLIFIPVGYWIIRLLAQGIANLSKFLYQKLQQRRTK